MHDSAKSQFWIVVKMEISRSAYLFNPRLKGSQLDFRIDSDKKLIANMEESNV